MLDSSYVLVAVVLVSKLGGFAYGAVGLIVESGYCESSPDQHSTFDVPRSGHCCESSSNSDRVSTQTEEVGVNLVVLFVSIAGSGIRVVISRIGRTERPARNRQRVLHEAKSLRVLYRLAVFLLRVVFADLTTSHDGSQGRECSEQPRPEAIRVGPERPLSPLDIVHAI